MKTSPVSGYVKCGDDWQPIPHPAAGKNAMAGLSDREGCFALAVAALREPCTGYFEARCRLRKSPLDRTAQEDLQRYRAYFYSEDFAVFSIFDPDRLLSLLDERAASTVRKESRKQAAPTAAYHDGTEA